MSKEFDLGLYLRCTSKVRYKSKSQALKVVKRYGGSCGQPYYCENCKGFHIGHPNKMYLNKFIK